MSASSLFDAIEGARRRDEALVRVEDHAPDDWYATAYGVVADLAGEPRTLTTDDVWQVLALLDVGPPPEPRAMGAVMRKAARAGLIVATDRTRPSERPESHRRPMRVWFAPGGGR